MAGCVTGVSKSDDVFILSGDILVVCVKLQMDGSLPDSLVVNSGGEPVSLVKGTPNNIKCNK